MQHIVHRFAHILNAFKQCNHTWNLSCYGKRKRTAISQPYTLFVSQCVFCCKTKKHKLNGTPFGVSIEKDRKYYDFPQNWLFRPQKARFRNKNKSRT